MADAKKLGKALLEGKYIACVNVMAPHVALYEYEGAYCEEEEVVLLCKVPEERVFAAKQAVAKLHPYDTPCIACWQLDDTAPEFLHWVQAAVR